jgi:predicted enzyme related to lactoylglutathione lyase
MADPRTDPVAYLELQTNDPALACGFYGRLFGWRAETVQVGGQSYLTLDLGPRIEGGIAGRATGRPVWLPYVEVRDVDEATDRAKLLGATTLLSPREGPAGWRSVLAVPGGGEIALWQPKR